MSTRCNIILRSPQGSVIWLYRHGDGYPKGDCGVLSTFWSVRLSLGARHYDPNHVTDPGWRQKWIGSFAKQLLGVTGPGGDLLHEITAGAHSDIDYLYLVDFMGFRKHHDDVMADATVRISERVSHYSEEFKRSFSSTPTLADAEKQEPFSLDDGLYKWVSRQLTGAERTKVSSQASGQDREEQDVD